MVVLKEIPQVPSPVASKACREDVEKIRQWDRTYGDSTRQLSVRAKSTKDKTRKRACEQLQKFGEHEQAGTRLNFANKSSKGNILRAVTNFDGPFITPTRMM